MTDKHHSDMKTLNDHIYAMLKNITDTISNTDKKEQKLTEISSKLSTYEHHMDKVIINKMKQPLPL